MDNKTKETVEPIVEEISDETPASTEREAMQMNAKTNGGGTTTSHGSNSGG